MPSTTVVSDEFFALARINAQALRMPYTAIVVVPHPIGGTDRKEVAKKADAALEDMIGVLTLPREKLPERAQEQLRKSKGKKDEGASRRVVR